MKRALAILLMALMSVPAALAEAPATQPAAAPAEGDRTADQPLVMVFPFDAVGEQAIGWVPVAIQQNLLAELSRTRLLRPAPVQVPEGKRADADAPRWAREQGAAYVVLGSYQLINHDLRVTGQVIDAKSGDVLGGLKATGMLRDLFSIEDTLAMQAKRLLIPTPPPPAHAATAPAAEPAPSPVAIQASGPVQIARPPMQTRFEGSALQKSLSDPRSYSQTYGNLYEPQYTQYRYYSSPLYPYFLYGGYPYYYGGSYSTIYTYPGTRFRMVIP